MEALDESYFKGMIFIRSSYCKPFSIDFGFFGVTRGSQNPDENNYDRRHDFNTAFRAPVKLITSARSDFQFLLSVYLLNTVMDSLLTPSYDLACSRLGHVTEITLK